DAGARRRRPERPARRRLARRWPGRRARPAGPARRTVLPHAVRHRVGAVARPLLPAAGAGGQGRSGRNRRSRQPSPRVSDPPPPPPGPAAESPQAGRLACGRGAAIPLSDEDRRQMDQIRQEEIAALRARAELGGTVWSRFNLAEILPEPTPMTWAIVRRFMSG